ncbi:hypothetical protein [Streptomyces sp. NPDC056937]|uniref:hypothetical protein n=1 Tax=Streptomyces sp. NPDC056937 TaxID=3345969 RepID=UPI003641F951
MSETTTTPAVHVPLLEPVPVDGCRICRAAVNGRETAHERGSAGSIREFNKIVEQHPHRRATDQGAER